MLEALRLQALESNMTSYPRDRSSSRHVDMFQVGIRKTQVCGFLYFLFAQKLLPVLPMASSIRQHGLCCLLTKSSWPLTPGEGCFP